MRLSLVLASLFLGVFNAGPATGFEQLVSFNKPTRQSSVWENGFSTRGVDGIKNSSYWGANTCTHTVEERQPWWEVDLVASHNITKVNITNRGDECCYQRLKSFYIAVHDGDAGAATRCVYVEAAMGAGEEREFACRAQGRYVRVGIDDPKTSELHILTLCEVEVVADLEPGELTSENVAVHKNATQSSTKAEFWAYLAVDDTVQPVLEYGPSCSITGPKFFPWWQVDLGSQFNVTHVAFTNRAEDFEQLSDVHVQLKRDGMFQDLWLGVRECGPIDKVEKGATVVVPCAMQDARYVQIGLFGRGTYDQRVLGLCEAQVYASVTVHAPSAQHMPVPSLFVCISLAWGLFLWVVL